MKYTPEGQEIVCQKCGRKVILPLSVVCSMCGCGAILKEPVEGVADEK